MDATSGAIASEPEPTKSCTSCGETKLLSQFGLAGSKRYPAQRRGNCRDCVNRSVSERPKKSTPDLSLLPTSCANPACTAANPAFTWRTDTGKYIPKCKLCIRDEAATNSARKAAERTARGSVACVDCGIVKPPVMFDSDRNFCKDCHLERRKQSVQTKQATREDAPPPVGKCGTCDSSLTSDNAIWRTDTKTWRMDRCGQCPPNPVYSERSRQKMAEEDYYGYRQRNNATHREWVLRNADKVAAYQHKRRTNPESKVKSIINKADSRGIAVSFADEKQLYLLLSCIVLTTKMLSANLYSLQKVYFQMYVSCDPLQIASSAIK